MLLLWRRRFFFNELSSQEFSEVVENTVVELEKHFRDELEEKCKVGATKAADAAVEFWDTFAEKKHWATMRASKFQLFGP